MEIVCPRCAAVNRVPAGKPAEKAKCGACKTALFSGKPADATAQNFATHIGRNEIPVVVDFWAAWCGPCRAMAPAYERVAGELEPGVRFLKVDTEAEQQLAAQYSIRSIPTVMMFKNGRMIAQRAGASDAASLRTWIEQNAG
jgi:thioredoxin 2